MSTGSEVSSSTREELLQSHVAQLTDPEDLERERAEKREIKAVREKEQENAREQLESVTTKLQKEKAQELKEHHDQLSRELEQKIKTLEKEHEDQIRDLNHAHEVEKRNLIAKLRAEINQEALGSKQEEECRKMHRQLFETEQQLSALEQKNADLMDTDRNTVNVLKDVEKQHRNETEKLNKQHRLALKKQMEELDAMNRKMQSKDKELAKLTERLSRMEADKDKLQDEVRRLKQAESWTRRSTTPPSLSPSSSMNDLVSKRERDMVIKNSELSFRVRTLEDAIAQLRQEKSKLQTKLSESRQQLAPLEEQKVKLGHRINDLNSSLRSREKKIEQLSKAVLELKSGKQQLEEETGRQRKSLQQQLSACSTLRAEKEKLKAKTAKLQKANTSLTEKLENLESENRDLHLSLSPPRPMSPLSPSSPPDIDSPLSSSANSSVLMEQLDQLEFDKEEIQTKYEEMKGEYVDLRDKYKKVRSKYEDIEGKYRNLQAACKLLEEKLHILEKEHRDLECEVVLLRRSGKTSPSHDVKRFETILESLQKQLEEKEKKIGELEDFIVEQDEVASKSEEILKREKAELESRLTESIASDMEQLNNQVNDLQMELEAANELLKSKEKEIEQLEEKLSSFGERSGMTGDDDGVGGPLSAGQLERCVQQYKTQIMQLDEKNVCLERDLADAIAEVSQLHELTVQLEGRLEEDHTAHEEAIAGRDEEIDQLNQRLTQLETKLIKLSRGLSFDPSDKDITPLADKVYEAIAKVRQAASDDSGVLNVAMVALEDAVKQLIYALIPTYTPMLPPTSPLNSCDTMTTLTSTSPTSPAPMSSPPASPAPPPPASPSAILRISSDFTELPLTYRTVLAAAPAETQDSWSQTRPPPSLHQSTQTPSARGIVEDNPTIRERPKTVNCSTQTPLVSKVRVRERCTQTPPPRRAVSSERATQTPTPRTPRRVERSSQTADRRKLLAIDNSSQTPRAWRQDVRQMTKPSGWSPDAANSSPILKVGGLQNGYSSPQDQLHGKENGPAHGIYNGSLNSTWPNNSWSKPVPGDEGERRSNGVTEELPRVFVAIMDYDPNSLCTTGRPELELTVHTGDVVCVEGEMDDDGYYHASFGGLTGLLPANFIQETEVANVSTRERLFNQSLSHNWSTSSSPVSSKGQQRSPLTHSQLSKEGSECSPQAPLSFHVEKALGHNGLLVAWQPPPIDSMCRSNGCLVTGYQVYVNGQTKSLVSGASQCRTLLSGLSLTKTLQLGISTSSVEGKSSKIIEIVYRGRPISSYHTAQLSRTTPEPETYRTFVALYDYDPAKCSPSDNPEFELSFKEGDLILVHGEEKDGFLVGELNGKQGWVPATFITQLSGSTDPGKSQLLSPTERPGGAHLTRSRRMVALYDYDPHHVSPNPNPDAELAFHVGDVITVYGYMQSDGFYSGELNGRCGLVPSNFLRET